MPRESKLPHQILTARIHPQYKVLASSTPQGQPRLFNFGILHQAVVRIRHSGIIFVESEVDRPPGSMQQQHQQGNMKLLTILFHHLT